MKKSIILFFIILFSGPPVYAGQFIVIVRGQDFPPYHYLDNAGDEQGVVIEIILSAAGAVGLDVTFRQYPWSRCLEMVKLGQADAMMNLFKTAKRQEFLSFSDNILIYEVNQFFKLRTTLIKYSGNPADLASLKLGTIRNYSYGPEFDAIDFSHKLLHETETDLIRSLVNKRCDVIIGNDIVIHHLEKKMGFDHVMEKLNPPVSSEPLYLGFSKAKGHQQMAEIFSKALARFKKTEAYADILKKYHIQ